MRIKKYMSIVIVAVLSLSVVSCTKKSDVAATEAKLPALQLSSLGYQQSSPFSTTTVLQLYFGATTTNTKTGAFKLEIYTGAAATGTAFKTVNFTSWNGKDVTSTATVTNHQISYTLEPTTYPNTNVYGGSILLKLSALGLASGSTYSVKASAYNADGTLISTYTQLSFFKVS
jgi:hypothetical protein